MDLRKKLERAAQVLPFEARTFLKPHLRRVGVDVKTIYYEDVLDSKEQRGKNIRVEVINSGNANHRHALTELPWDKQFGRSFEGDTYAGVFRNRIGCTGCDFVVIRSEAGQT